MSRRTWLLAAATLVLAACQPPVRRAKPSFGEPTYRVLIVGDSLSTNNAEVQQKYAGYAFVEAGYGRKIARRNMGGRSAAELAIPLAKALKPKVIVVQLGVNDMVGTRPVAEVLSDTERFLQALPAASTVIWVAVACDTEPERTAHFNAWLRSHVNTVLPWDTWNAANPGHLTDGIHPDGLGADALWKMVGDALRIAGS